MILPPSFALGLRSSIVARGALTALAAAFLGVGACSLDTQGTDSHLASSSTSGPSGSGGAGSGAGGEGGTAPPPICFPQSTIPCYEGKAGTQGVGLCRGGQQTCNPDGQDYGVCSGQIVPTMENCVSPEDEDCDEDPGKCTGDPEWSRGMGGPEFETAVGVAVDPDDNVIVTGTFYGAANFGDKPHQSIGDGDIYIAKYSPINGLLWSKSFGSSDRDVGLAVASDADGNIFVTGQFRNTIDFGLGPFKNGGGDDIFLLKLDPSGKVIFAKHFGNDGDQYSVGIAVGMDGGPVITGRFTGSVSFDTGAPTLTSVGDFDVFLVKLGPGGEYQWGRQFGDGAIQEANAVAAGPGGANGRIVIVGRAAGQFKFGSIDVTPSNNDAFVAAFDGKGTALYARVFGDVLDQAAFGVALDNEGNALVTGDFAGKMMFDKELEATPLDVFVARLSPTGVPQWSQRLGGTGEHRARGIAVDPFGNAVLVGNSNGDVNFNMETISSSTRDVLVAKLGPDGAVIWAKVIGDESIEQYGLDIATDSKANILVSGEFDSKLPFMGPPIMSVGGRDAFIAKLAP